MQRGSLADWCRHLYEVSGTIFYLFRKCSPFSVILVIDRRSVATSESFYQNRVISSNRSVTDVDFKRENADFRENFDGKDDYIGSRTFRYHRKCEGENSG